MKNQINDGGPAFPVSFEGDKPMTVSLGISIRDYFAAAALPSVDQRSTGNPDQIACECYQLADAMLKAREVKP